MLIDEIINFTKVLMLAAICGGAIGMEREIKARPAGIKTFSLVCMGAAMVMMTNEYIYLNIANSTGDAARMGAQVISGIGFLGAGTIIVTSNNRVRGLTTAAALWVTAAIGIAIGIHFYSGAVIGTILILCTSAISRQIDIKLARISRIIKLFIETEGEAEMARILDYFEKNNCTILSSNKRDVTKWIDTDYAVTVEIHLGNRKKHEKFITELRKIQGVRYLYEI